MPSPIDCDLPTGTAQRQTDAGIAAIRWNGSQHAPGSLAELTKSADGGAVHDVPLRFDRSRGRDDRSRVGRHVGR